MFCNDHKQVPVFSSQKFLCATLFSCSKYLELLGIRGMDMVTRFRHNKERRSSMTLLPIAFELLSALEKR
ncbi:hypothetical protein OPV22_021201 [Ensete ventricosum]|uniref:Uncharacterized protein n=1 Tax=Ensete ventricosum TaxID=4639 RepID=A0AAV8QRG0_ENSVE|nr:hypothetical protein OPV22_021201 [Ensete ventricosum]